MFDFKSKEFQNFIDCIQDGVFITDNKGTILACNKQSLDLCCYAREELIGENINDLVDNGMFDDAIALKVIKNNETMTELQKSLSGQLDLLVTGTPFYEKGQLSYVIVTERDVSHLVNVKNNLCTSDKMANDKLYYYAEVPKPFSEYVYESPAMAQLVNMLLQVSLSDATVLLQGESGTGKGLFAKLIHQSSQRASTTLLEINCGSIPENLLESELFGYEEGAFTGASADGKKGLFEVAKGGTIFLDEINSLPHHMQAKLLRVIQEKEIMRIGSNKYIPVDVRVIAASNDNLDKLVQDKLFRADLYYRLNVCNFTIPPLRQRREDILPLSEVFLKKFNSKYKCNKLFAQATKKLLFSYNWPGNVRELENLIERLVLLTPDNIISSDNIALLFPSFECEPSENCKIDNMNLKEELERYEETLIRSQLKTCRTATELAQKF